jgi:hypothetical protein
MKFREYLLLAACLYLMALALSFAQGPPLLKADYPLLVWDHTQPAGSTAKILFDVERATDVLAPAVPAYASIGWTDRKNFFDYSAVAGAKYLYRVAAFEDCRANTRSANSNTAGPYTVPTVVVISAPTTITIKSQ